jgi:hypothetical protein
MADDEPKLPQDFMQRLSKATLTPSTPPSTALPEDLTAPEVKKYAPPTAREAAAKQRTNGGELSATSLPSLHSQTPLQQIAQSTKRLIWDDCEQMAAMICKHLDNGGITGPVMAKAVQAAADEILHPSGSRQD